MDIAFGAKKNNPDLRKVRDKKNFFLFILPEVENAQI